MKTWIRVILMVAAVGLSSPTWAATPWTSFIGPKITNAIKIDNQDFPIVIPGDFTSYEILGGDPIDAAVPSNLRGLLGAKNLNKWEEAGPNVFFDLKTDTYPAIAWQAMHGEFNGNTTPDLIVISLTLPHFEVCYDYDGSSCVGGRDTIWATKESGMSPDEPKNLLHPIFGRVADLNGDGQDDLALITWDTNQVNQGHYIFFPGTGAGIGNPFGAHKSVHLGRITPYSIAVGDFNNDSKLDVAIGSEHQDNTNRGVLSILLNSNPSPDIHSFNFAEDTQNRYANCLIPFGLEAQDANGDGFSDVVMTCLLQRQIDADGNPTHSGGPVLILRNLAANGKTFNTEQTLTRMGQPGLDYPTRTAVGDLDNDGNYDLAVAEWGGRNVRVYHGSDTFKVATDTVRDLDTTPYPPMFIQYQDENNDGRLDIILTANAGGNLARNNIRYTDNVASVSSYPGYISRLCVDRDSIPNDNTSAILTVDRNQLDQLPFQENIVGYRLDQSGDAYSATYDAGSQDTITRGVYISDNTDERLGGPNAAVANPRVCDGILVYLNFDPEVTFGDVDCYSSTIKFKCEANGGNTITSCDVSSPDATLDVVTAPAAPNWEGEIKVPADKKVFTVVVVAKDDGGGTYTGTLNVNLEDCPGPGGTDCPVEPVKATVWPREPFSLCVPPEMADKAVSFGSTIEWQQVDGPDLLGVGDKSFTYKGISAEGPCITGAFELGPEAFQKEEFKFNYIIKNVGGQDLSCPAELVKLQAQVEGSGTAGCSLNKKGWTSGSLSWAIGLLGLLGVAMAQRQFQSIRNRR